MSIRSYEARVFVIESSDSVIREDDLATPQRYAAGDQIPPGRQIGDEKIIPQRTEITVTDVRADANRHVFVFARAANDDNAIFGWTKAMNLVGSFANETVGFAPSDWKQEPDGNNKTCVDAKALIRGGPPDFAPTTNAIPQRSL